MAAGQRNIAEDQQKSKLAKVKREVGPEIA